MEQRCVTIRMVQRGEPRAWEGDAMVVDVKRWGEIAMNVSVLMNAVGGAVFIASNATPR